MPESFGDTSGDDYLPMKASNKYKLLGKFGNWKLYTDSKHSKLCYITSTPINIEGYYADRYSMPKIIISYLGGGAYTVSLYKGVRSSENGTSRIKINNKVFALNNATITYAYTYDSQQDTEIINNMLKNLSNYITIENDDILGAFIIDHYTMDGFKEAMLEMNTRCENNERDINLGDM